MRGPPAGLCVSVPSCLGVFVSARSCQGRPLLRVGADAGPSLRRVPAFVFVCVPRSLGYPRPAPNLISMDISGW